MCTLVILRRPDHDWPLIVAANRDEMRDRPWRPPARHWPDRRHVTAGLDELAGGTWLALNDDRLVAGVLNRRGSLGPDTEKRSRGELPLDAADHAEAGAAAEALAYLEPASFRTFNLFVGDAESAFWLRSDGEEVAHLPVPAGLSMITAYDLNDPESPRMRRYRPLFEAAPAPNPESGDWAAWQALLSESAHDAEAGPGGAMNVDNGSGFGTVSSSLLALPARHRIGVRPVWLFSAGPPGTQPWRTVEL